MVTCLTSDTNKTNYKWVHNTMADPNTGQPENNTTDPCLLLQATIGSAGATVDLNLLTAEDRAATPDTGNGDQGNGTGSDGSSGASCGSSGKYSALVSQGASFAGVDQGIDFVPSNSSGFDICAPAAGTITLADQTGHHFDRTDGQAVIIEKLDQSPSAPSSSNFIYYAEIIQINSNIKVGAHVNAGDVIGHNNKSPGIEVGWAPDATHGFMCPIGGATACGDSFDKWIQDLATQQPRVSGNAQDLAKQILANSNIDLKSYKTSVFNDVQAAADGKPGTAGEMTSTAILSLIATIGEKHKVLVTAIQSDGQGHCGNKPKSECPGDPHYNGDAVDFGSLDGHSLSGRDDYSKIIIEAAERLLPSGSRFGQSNCGSVNLKPGFSEVEDACNHLHVDVPGGTP
jgi:hypothetical protein